MPMHRSFFQWKPVLRRIVFVFLLLLSFLGVVRAFDAFDSLPSSPLGQLPGGTFSGTIQDMIGVCGSSQFLKWFDENYQKICVPSNGVYSGSAISPLVISDSGYPTTIPAGQIIGGKFRNYLRNFRGVCSGTGIVKSIESDGWKNCVSPDNPDVIISGTHTANSFSNTGPAASPGPAGWNYQTYFSNMVDSTACNVPGKAIVGFSPTGEQICAIVPFCGVKPVYDHVTFTSGAPTSANQAWVYSATAGNCTFSCDTNYAWNGIKCLPVNKDYPMNVTYQAGCWGGCGANWVYSGGPSSIFEDLTSLTSNGFRTDASGDLYSIGQSQTECCSYSHRAFGNNYLCSASDLQNGTCAEKMIVNKANSDGGDDELILQSGKLNPDGSLSVTLRATSYGHGWPYVISYVIP